MTFFCRSCNVGLTSQERQKEHHKLDILQHLYHCQRCSCTFKTYSELNNHFDHTKVHQEEKVPPSNVKPSKYCVHCRRKFKSDGQFAIHLKRAHKEMGHCRECGKVFSDKSALNQVKSFSDILSSKNSSIFQHRKSPAHSQKDFPCPHCTRSFKNASAVLNTSSGFSLIL
ncbi:hypothetical protein FRB91_002881 [Serendipita sp. 411]|nr:hypothetical protein FRB91_002881 [Serendipita sp. 411]